MAGVDRRFAVRRAEHDVRRLLVDEGFLHAFVDLQHPVAKQISADPSAQSSTCRWTSSLDGEIPGLVQRFVGDHVNIVLVMDLKNGTLRMNAEAKRRGDLTAQLRITGDGDQQSALSIDGEVRVSGFGGGLAESTVRDEVIVPVFQEDLVPLLEKWHN